MRCRVRSASSPRAWRRQASSKVEALRSIRARLVVRGSVMLMGCCSSHVARYECEPSSCSTEKMPSFSVFRHLELANTFNRVATFIGVSSGIRRAHRPPRGDMTCRGVRPMSRFDLVSAIRAAVPQSRNLESAASLAPDGHR